MGGSSLIVHGLSSTPTTEENLKKDKEDQNEKMIRRRGLNTEIMRNEVQMLNTNTKHFLLVGRGS